MKSNAKSKLIILIALGIVFALSPMINNSLNFNTGKSDDSNFDKEYLKISAVSGNIVNNSRNAGIYLKDSDNNIIKFNTIINNSVGIYLIDSYSNEISNNIYNGNGVNIKRVTGENFPLWIEFAIVIPTTVIIAIVMTIGILKRNRRASKDEVARLYELKEQEKQYPL